MFWNKKDKRTVEDNDLLDAAINRLEHRLTVLETEVLDIAQSQQLIRDKILRKIRLKSRQEDEEEEETTVFGIPKAKN